MNTECEDSGGRGLAVAGRATLSVVACLVAACSGSISTEANTSGKDGVTRRDTEIVHEECPIDGGGNETLDADSDGRADVVIVKSGGKEVCRSLDLNADGKVDAWIYSDAAGNVRRVESDYDRDGRIDEIQIYERGSKSEVHQATTLDGKLDTWHFYKAGKLARTERDSDGDGVIDQWWEYPDPAKVECPVIHADADGDGRPDPEASVDVCKSPSYNYVPPERNAPPPDAPALDSKPDVPVETDSKPSVPVETSNEPAGESEGGE